MNELPLMTELKETALRAERLSKENTDLRRKLALVEWCSYEGSCPECGYKKPHHNSGGCKLRDALNQ